MNDESLSQKAKTALINYVKEIDVRLAKYWDSQITDGFGFNERQRKLVSEILLHAKEHNLRPAKRARGAFVSYAYKLSGKSEDERIWKVAMAVELVHTALLMHDDFMDQDEVRRGGPTTHKFFADMKNDAHYGDAMGVGVGDGVLCMGFALLNNCGFSPKLTNKAMAKMLSGIGETSWGQAYDVTLGVEKEWTENDVISLHRAKTAIYTYENPLLIGAILGEVPEPALRILSDYAADGGVAFQIQDDILGVFGSEDETGKSADSDLKQGKCTLLVLKALELGNEAQKAAVKRVWGNKDAKQEDLAAAKKVIMESGSLEYSRKTAVEYATKAVEIAEKLRELNLDKEAVDYIAGIAAYMVERKV